MACQRGRKPTMEGLTTLIKLHLVMVVLIATVRVGSTMSVGDNSMGFNKQGYGFQRMPYKSQYKSPYKSAYAMKQQQIQAQMQQQRRVKQTGNEIIPAVGSNDISDEPTCEELRAMWRYYKRQSRAELTNEIPQFGKNPFLEMLPTPPRNPVFSSFGMGGKARNKNPMRPQNYLYGRVVHKPSKSTDRGSGRNRNKPFEIVRERLRNPGGNGDLVGSVPTAPTTTVSNIREINEGGVILGSAAGAPPPVMVAMAAVTSTPASAIVHYSPPRRPAKESSFQKLRDIIAGERRREGGTSSLSSSGTDNREYGKIVLSPPQGQDGRRINKTPENMTPFEQIRFGHADDILEEGIRHNLGVMKRRTIPLSVLKTQWKQQQLQQAKYQSLQKRRFLSNPVLLLTSSSSSRSGDGGDGVGDASPVDHSTSFISSKYFEKRAEENNNNNNIIAQTNDKQQLDSLFESENVPSQMHQNNPTTALFPSIDNVIINNGDYKDSIINEDSSPSALPKYTTNPLRQTVELPTCVEVEHEPCNQTFDCSCIGFALYRCYLNQCQILPLAYSVPYEAPALLETEPVGVSSSAEDSPPDIWHSEPVPSEKLGKWQEPLVLVNVDDSPAARLSTFRERRNANSKIEGKPNLRITDATYAVLPQQNLYA